MKYWHYLVPYLLMGIVILIDVGNVSYKEDCIRYGQPRVCLIDKPPTRFRGGKGAFSYNYFAIEFTLEDQDSIINESNNLQGMASIDVTPLTSACGVPTHESTDGCTTLLFSLTGRLMYP